MSATGPHPMVKGWCPGALRPMESGDGLILRLRISGGIVDIPLAARIAQWSNHWGNGQIDLSNRANLQLRGLTAEHLPALQDTLANWNLVDSSNAAEAVRNVISSPLAGIDPATLLDVRPIARDLEQRLSGDASLHNLPGKFGFAIDDGGLLRLDDVTADIKFAARLIADAPAFEIELAGAPHHRLGPCRPDAVADVAATLGRIFLRFRTGQETTIRRMQHLIAAIGIETIARNAALEHIRSPRPKRIVHPSGFLGVQPLGAGAFVGIGLPFGRILSKDLAELASAAAANGAQALRLTPWRAILVPVPSTSAAHSLAARLTARSFILDPDDARLRIAACPGAPSCARATTPVRSDADKLAAEIAGVPGTTTVIHISGCEKGCAHPKPAPITLVGRNGRYDLVRNDIASASPVARNLTMDQVIKHLKQTRHPRNETA
jgi:precorrin-3B synthase